MKVSPIFNAFNGDCFKLLLHFNSTLLLLYDKQKNVELFFLALQENILFQYVFNIDTV